MYNISNKYNSSRHAFIYFIIRLYFHLLFTERTRVKIKPSDWRLAYIKCKLYILIDKY